MSQIQQLNIKLSKALKKRSQQNKLAHFYLLSTQDNNEEIQNSLLNWAKDLAANILNQHASKQNLEITQKKVQSLGHSDLLLLSPSKASYQINDISSLQRFFDMAPFEGRYQVAIITDAFALTTPTSNKLLKILEEPQSNCTIFMLNPGAKELISTINSRAIKLHLKTASDGLSDVKAPNDLDQLAKDIITKKISLHDALAALRQNKARETAMLMAISKALKEDYASNKKYFELEKLLKDLNWFEQSKTFNNRLEERFFSLLIR